MPTGLELVTSEVIPGVISLILTPVHCSSLAARRICYFLGPNTIHSPTVTTLSHLITGDCLDVSRPTCLSDVSWCNSADTRDAKCHVFRPEPKVRIKHRHFRKFGQLFESFPQTGPLWNSLKVWSPPQTYLFTAYSNKEFDNY